MEENKKSSGTLIIVILLILLIAVSGYVVYEKLYVPNNGQTKTGETKDLKESISETKSVIALSDGSDKFVLLNEKGEKTYEYTIKTPNSTKYSIIKVDGNYLYYTEGDYLYRLNLETKKSEALDIKMEGYWYFYVNNNDLIYDVLNTVYYVNIKDKTTTKLDVESNNNCALINGIYYYTRKDNKSLVAYNLTTKKEEVVSKNARLVTNDKNSIIYAAESGTSEEFILYNVSTGNKKVISNGTTVSNNDYYAGTLFNDKAYLFSNNTLNVINGTESKELYKYVSQKDYSKNYSENIKYSIMLSENKMLLVVLLEDTTKPCEGEGICDPVIAEKRTILVDIKNNTSTKVETNIDFIYDDSIELQRIYK